MLSVIAEIEIADGKREEFLSQFSQVVPLVQAEEGCIEYGPTVDVVTEIPAQVKYRENVVTIVEKWESLDALMAHLVAPHMDEYRDRVKHLVVGSALRVLESV